MFVHVASVSPRDEAFQFVWWANKRINKRVWVWKGFLDHPFPPLPILIYQAIVPSSLQLHVHTKPQSIMVHLPRIHIKKERKNVSNVKISLPSKLCVTLNELSFECFISWRCNKITMVKMNYWLSGDLVRRKKRRHMKECKIGWRRNYRREKH